jgi:Flp pilus assembly protein TadG
MLATREGDRHRKRNAISNPRRQRPARRGAAAVEAALVLGLCLYFMMGVFEFGRLFMMRNLVLNAVREGARLAVAGTSTKTTAQIQSTVTSYLAGQQFSNLVVQVYAADANGNSISGTNWYDVTFGSGIGVQIDADYAAIVPTFGVLPSTLHIKVKSVMKSEST